MLAQHMSSTQEHFTPRWLVEPARKVLRDIELDPASCSLAQEVVGAWRYYSLDERGEDGLVLPWLSINSKPAQRVFLNSPGGAGGRVVKAFWKRAVEHVDRNPHAVVVVICFSLEQILSLTKAAGRGPLHYAAIIPTKRVAYDTVGIDGVSLMDVVKNENPEATTAELKRLVSTRLETERANGRLGRAVGKNPPHGSMVAIVSKKETLVTAGLVSAYRDACIEHQGTEPVVSIPGIDTSSVSWDNLP